VKFNRVKQLISKSILAALVLALAWTISCPAARADIVDRIVASVNGEIITMKELNDKLSPLLKSGKIKGQDEMNQARRQILQTLIERKLIEQEAGRLGLRVSDREMQMAIEHFKSSKNLTQEQLQAELAKDGMTWENFQNELRFDLLRSEVIHDEVVSRIAISAEEVKDYLEKHRAEFNLKTKVHLRNILIALPEQAADADIKAGIAEAGRVREEIENGLEFTEAAKRYSKASNAQDGGDLGRIAWDDLNEIIGKAIGGLKPGQVSQPVLADQGVQLFQLVENIERDEKGEAEAKAEIRRRISQELLQGRIEAWFKELRAKSIIQIKF